MDPGVSLNQPVQVGAGIAIGACAGLWSLGILLFVILFLTNRGRFLQRQPRLWELTHVVAWIWSFQLGLTMSLVWVWHRFQGLDLSQRTHWIYRLSWTSLTFLPLLPFTTVIVISAVLLIKGQAFFQLRVPVKRTRSGAGGASPGLRLRGPWDCVIGNYSAWEKRVSRNPEIEQEETLATPLRESGVYEL